MKNGKNLAIQIVETAVDGKLGAKTFLDINSANFDEIDLFAGRTNAELKKIKESPSVVYIRATKETDGFYVATVEAIKELIVNGLYIISLDVKNNTNSVNIRINGTIAKNLSKISIIDGSIQDLEIGDMLGKTEYLYRYNGDKFVMVSSNALSLDGVVLEEFVLKSEVVDDLVSSDTNLPLSANQGQALDKKIDAVDSNLTKKINLKAPIESPAFTGTVTGVTNTMVGLGNVTNDAQVKRSEMGAPNGVAVLDEAGLIPSSHLPSYVDDVLEFDSIDDFPAVGESGKIYVDTDTNLTYRWSGTQYTEISKSLALGETASTAYSGDKGKKNAEDIALLGNRKADKVTDAVSGNFAGLDSNGNLVNSGNKPSDFALKTYSDSEDIRILGEAKTYTDESIAAIPVPDVSGQIEAHNSSTDSHADIRLELEQKTVSVDNETISKDSSDVISAIAVKEQNLMSANHTWVGTKKQYTDLGDRIDATTTYILTDDYDDIIGKADKTYVDEQNQILKSAIELKADKSYVDKEFSKKAESHTFVGTFQAQSWGEAAPFTQTVSIKGLKNTMEPIADIILSDSVDSAKAELLAYEEISRLEAKDGVLVGTCFETRPEANFTIQLKVVQPWDNV